MNPLFAIAISLLLALVLVGLFPVGNVAFSVAAVILGGNALLAVAFGVIANKINK